MRYGRSWTQFCELGYSNYVDEDEYCEPYKISSARMRPFGILKKRFSRGIHSGRVADSNGVYLQLDQIDQFINY